MMRMSPMLRTARRWTAAVLALLLALLALCALAVFLLDPFEHYRESAILPLYDQESYNNPGIARNYDYNAVILADGNDLVKGDLLLRLCVQLFDEYDIAGLNLILLSAGFDNCVHQYLPSFFKTRYVRAG